MVVVRIVPETDNVVSGSSYTIAINSSPSFLGTPSTGIDAGTSGEESCG